ncbi:hypothetical protein Tco_0680654 [Tanacetum coccineum]|uniref:Reverse transcriptase domain-containing protein n=1 Tax=Tanacetum coccineum TaxID=301880 RepID=A0ABQ4XL40_9ASTR
MMTARKRVGPLPTHRLTVRHSVDYSSSDYFTSDYSSRDSPSNSSSEAPSDSSSDTLFDSSSGHSSSDHSSLALPSGTRSSHQLCSSISSIPHSSAAIIERPSHFSSVGPSRKRSRSPTTSVLVSSPVPGALSSVHANLLPLRKRIRSSDSVTDLEDFSDESSESSVPRETSLRDDVVVRGSAEGVDARVVVETAAREEVETSARGMVEVIMSIQRDQGHMIVATGQQSAVQSERISELERDNTILRGMLDVASQRIGRLKACARKTMPNTRSGVTMTCKAVNELIGRQVAEALEARDATRNIEPLAEVNGNGNRGGNRNGNGNRNGGGNGYENHNNTHKRTIRIEAAYALTWKKLMKLMTEVYPNNIPGELVITAETTRLQEAICIANNLMDQKLKGYARSAENKRRPGHYRKDCPKLRNQNRGNKTGNIEATSKAYAIRGGGANPDSNVVTGTFLLNNCYASMLFDSGADKSFVSSTFSALLDVAPSTLDTSYAVELANGRISETNVILRGCTLGLLGHPFNIDLMPIELGGFDVIIVDSKTKAWISYRVQDPYRYVQKDVRFIQRQDTSKKH